MKLKALSLALFALPITSFAIEPVSHQPTDVSFSVEAEKEVERDYYKSPFLPSGRQ